MYVSKLKVNVTDAIVKNVNNVLLRMSYNSRSPKLLIRILARAEWFTDAQVGKLPARSVTSCSLQGAFGLAGGSSSYIRAAEMERLG